MSFSLSPYTCIHWAKTFARPKLIRQSNCMCCFCKLILMVVECDPCGGQKSYPCDLYKFLHDLLCHLITSPCLLLSSSIGLISYLQSLCVHSHFVPWISCSYRWFQLFSSWFSSHRDSSPNPEIQLPPWALVVYSRPLPLTL